MRYNREKLTAVMEQNNVEAMIVSDEYNMRYISQFRGEGYLYLTKETSGYSDRLQIYNTGKKRSRRF